MQCSPWRCAMSCTSLQTIAKFSQNPTDGAACEVHTQTASTSVALDSHCRSLQGCPHGSSRFLSQFFPVSEECQSSWFGLHGSQEDWSVQKFATQSTPCQPHDATNIKDARLLWLWWRQFTWLISACILTRHSYTILLSARSLSSLSRELHLYPSSQTQSYPLKLYWKFWARAITNWSKS